MAAGRAVRLAQCGRGVTSGVRVDQGSLPRVRSTLSARWKKRALTRVLASFLPAAAWGRCEGSWGSTGDFARLRVRSWCQGIRKGAAATFGGGVGLPRSRPRCAPSISARADDRCAAFPASLGRKLEDCARETTMDVLEKKKLHGYTLCP